MAKRHLETVQKHIAFQKIKIKKQTSNLQVEWFVAWSVDWVSMHSKMSHKKNLAIA